MKKNIIVRTFCFIALMIGLNFVFMACSSEDDDANKTSDLIFHNILGFGDYVMDVEDMPGIVDFDSNIGVLYLEDAEKNRYYINYYNREAKAEFNELYKEGDIIKFSAKVYALHEDWINETRYMPELAKDINLYAIKTEELSISKYQ